MAYLDDLSLFAGDNELMGGGQDPISIRLNNPGAIRPSPVRWAGMSPEQPGGYVQFETPEDGINAMSRNLDAYGSKYGLNTIRGIIERWAPAKDRNNTAAYIDRVASAVKIDPDQPLPLDDPAFKARFMATMAGVEAGRAHGPYSADNIEKVITGQAMPSARPPSQGAPSMPMPDDYDPDAGLARMAQMGQRVGQMQQPGPMPQQRTVGLDALSPYMQLAAQLSPQRRQGDWSDALLSAGIGMMQTNRPDFFGGLGQGLAAAQGTMQQQEKQRFEDAQAQSKLGLNLYSAFQKDETPVSLAKGAMLVGKDGRMIANNPDVEPPKTREVKIGDRLVTQEWNGAMWKTIGEADRREVPAGYTRDENGNLKIDPGYLRDQTDLRRAGAPSVNVDLKGQTAGAQESAKLDAKKLDGMRSQADAAAGALDDINTVEGWLKGLDTGSLAPEKLAAQKFLGGLGINTNIFGSKEQVAKAEAALTIVNQMALKLRNPESGLGMPGAMSDKDLAFLKQSTVGLETTEPGRNLIIDLTRRAASRRMEIARMADEFYYQNDNSFKGWPQFLKQWRDANPLFSDADIAAAKQAAGAPQSGALPSRGLPESDAERTRRLDQERQNDDKRRGVYTPGTTIPLPPPPSQAAPQGQGTPRFTDPNDPDLAKLPPGTVFIDGNGVPRVKP